MKQLFSGKALFYQAAIILFFAVLSIVYCKPILDKKRLVQHDIVMSVGAAHEVAEYQKQTGEYSAWTNSMFGGMPAYTVVGSYPNSWTSYVASKISYIFPDPANYIFLLLVGCYIGLSALGYSRLLSVMGALAFGFSSYTSKDRTFFDNNWIRSWFNVKKWGYDCHRKGCREGCGKP